MPEPRFRGATGPNEDALQEQRRTAAGVPDVPEELARAGFANDAQTRYGH